MIDFVAKSCTVKAEMDVLVRNVQVPICIQSCPVIRGTWSKVVSVSDTLILNKEP